MSSSVRRAILNRSLKFSDLSGTDFETQVLAYELAIAVNDNQFENDEISRETWGQVNRELRAARENLRAETQADFSNYKRPRNTTPDAQVFARARWTAGDKSFVFGAMPAAHSLSDDNSNYQNESELKIGELSFDYSPARGALNVNSFILYSAVSLQPRDYFTGGLSGLFRAGVEKRLVSDLNFTRAAFLEGGGGLTYRFMRDVDVYSMTTLGAQASDTSSPFSVSPSLGVIVREAFAMKTMLQYTHDYHSTGQAFSRTSAAQIVNLGHYSLMLKFESNRNLRADRSAEAGELEFKFLF